LKPLGTAGIVLLVAAILLISFFEAAYHALPTLVVWISLAVFALAGASFGASRLNPKQDYVIAIILLLVGAVVIIGPVAYAETRSTIGCLGPCGNNGGSPFINGTLTIGSGSDGVLTLEFRTVGSVGTVSPSITNITVRSSSSVYGTAFSNLSYFEFIYQGNQVSAANPLPWDQTAMGSIAVTNVTAGTIYDIICYWHLSNDPSHADSGQFSLSVSS